MTILILKRSEGLIIALFILLLAILLLPFFSRIIERNLEVFLLICGLLSLFISKVQSMDLLLFALKSPIKITIAVFLAGFLFKIFQSSFEQAIFNISKKVRANVFLAILVIVLGLLSSLMTAIISAIILSSIVKVLQMDRRSEVHFVIIACFAIGLGAVLTPIGEPLSTITTNKLSQNFSFLFTLLSRTIIPGVILLGLLAATILHPRFLHATSKGQTEPELFSAIVWRTVKVYIFVLALTLLGASFEPFIAHYLLDVHPFALYWLNMISAILDNATLAAAEISHDMDITTIRAILLGLLVSGGMLIQGNIPNIIVANQLNISSKEWARFGVPLGLIGMIFYFIIIFIIS